MRDQLGYEPDRKAGAEAFAQFERSPHECNVEVCLNALLQYDRFRDDERTT